MQKPKKAWEAPIKKEHAVKNLLVMSLFNNKLSFQNAVHFLQFYDIKVSNIVDNRSTLVTTIIKGEKERVALAFLLSVAIFCLALEFSFFRLISFWR